MPRFVDTNIALYAASPGSKQLQAREIILGALISVQVLNEAMNVCRRKWRLGWNDTDEVLDAIVDLAREVRPISLVVHQLGRDISERYQLSVYDSLLLASAVDAGCDQFYSEDLHHGQIINRTLAIIDPFT